MKHDTLSIAAAPGRAVAMSSATKADVDSARSDRKHDMDPLRADRKREVEQARTEVEKARIKLVSWAIAGQATLAGIIIAVIKL